MPESQLALETTIRTFIPGDGARIAEAWTVAIPRDPITTERFRDLILLDRNFDASGLFVATDNSGHVVGSTYAVRRHVFYDSDDSDRNHGWIIYLFVVPEYRGRGIGRQLLAQAEEWFSSRGLEKVFFSSYTPNYFLPGIDADRYAEGFRLMGRAGFTVQYKAVAMERNLHSYTMPDPVTERVHQLSAAGYYVGSPGDDDLVDLIRLAGERFNMDWARVIREEAVRGMSRERILIIRDPDGVLLGWAMHGAYENVIDRFGPFGVVPESRGKGLGEVLLHLTLQRMQALGAHNAWFLWTDEESPAGHLYHKDGFATTRTFSVLEKSLG